MRKSKMNEISDKLANRVANARKLNAIGAIDRYNKIDKEYDADLEKVFKKYSDEEVSAGKANKEFDNVIKKYEPLLNPEEKTIKKAEKNQELMARRTRRSKFDKRKNESVQKNESKMNEISDELANRFLDKRVKNAVKNFYDDDSYDKETRAVKSLIRRKARQGKPLTNDEKTYMRGEGEKFESKINEVSREKANKVVKRYADQQYDALVNYNINKPETVKALHNAEDKLDKALRLRRNSTKLRKDESMFNKYGEEVDPKEWENKEARGLNEAKSNEVNIFLTNLGKYNEGELVGEWVELPVDDFQPILDRIGINDEYEEWFITDYEAPFEIHEYDDIEELNDIAREIQDFDSTQLEVLDTYKENGYDMRDAIDKVIENDYFYLEGNTEEDLAWSYIDAIGDFENAVSKEDRQYYFDYEAYGRDLVLGGDYSYVKDVVDLNSFADKDTAEMVFGSYGEDKPSEEDIAKYKKWIEIYGDYTDEQEEELAKQGIEVFMTSIYVDEVAYDVETLEQVIGEDYEVQSGYKDYEGNIVDVSSEKELAEYVVDELFGGVDQLGDEEIERYFDYAWWGKTLAYDFYKTDNGWVQLD